jgi:hypothetical protein
VVGAGADDAHTVARGAGEDRRRVDAAAALGDIGEPFDDGC